jgi:itaconyl-CoA hydratase
MTEPRTVARGTHYEDHEPGRRFVHHWGRTLTQHDVIDFATMTSQYNPLHFNAEYARAQGHPDVVAPGLLVYNIVLGLSVEDLSEAGGPFLNLTGVTFPLPVYPGDTLTAESVVLNRRPSGSRPGWGIVEWETTGHRQDGACVVRYRRANLALCREGSGNVR